MPLFGLDEDCKIKQTPPYQLSMTCILDKSVYYVLIM